MSSGGSAHALVCDVPWESVPSLANQCGTGKIRLESLRKTVDPIPVGKTTIPFRSDTWDFNGFYDGVNDASYVLRFSGLPDDVKDVAKFYALDRLRAGRKVSTVKGQVAVVKSVLSEIWRKAGHSSLLLVTTEDVIAEIAGRESAPATLRGNYAYVMQFLKFAAKEFGAPIAVDLERLRALASEAERWEKETGAERKIPDIPTEYFNAIVQTAVGIMRREDADYNRRATSCLIVMLSQLGLRINDLLAIRVHQLHSKKLDKIGRTANFIRYGSRKPTRQGGPMLEFDIHSNPLCTEAFETLAEIRELCTLSSKGDFLYVLNPVGSSNNELPISRTRFRNEYAHFFADELPEMCRREWEGIGARSYHSSSHPRFEMHIPTTQQYRVRVCTALYERNVPLLYIQRYMGHLSEAMIGYYARPKDATKECIRYAEEIVRDIVEDDARLLGGANGDEVKDRILERLASCGEVTAASSVGDVAQICGGSVSIRAKTGGVCINTQLMGCSRGNRTDALLCAYNLCPNLYHLYHMVDATYADFLTLQSTYEAAEGSARPREAQRELNKMRDLCRRRLIPELDELEREVARKGEAAVLERHGHLLGIIASRGEIRREIEAWMSM